MTYFNNIFTWELDRWLDWDFSFFSGTSYPMKDNLIRIKEKYMPFAVLRSFFIFVFNICNKLVTNANLTFRHKGYFQGCFDTEFIYCTRNLNLCNFGVAFVQGLQVLPLLWKLNMWRLCDRKVLQHIKVSFVTYISNTLWKSYRVYIVSSKNI